MSSTNPFSYLDPEQAPKQETPKNKDVPKHEEPIKQQNPPKQHDVAKEHKNPAKPNNDEELKAEKEPVVHQKYPHEGPKQKGVPAEPHPLDRKSGTGRGKEVSKGGAGRHAWGTLEDEVKREGQYDDVEEKNYIVTEEKPTAENLITLNEFKHKENADEGKDLKKQQPPVLGSHSETLGFNTEGTEKTVEKKEGPHPEKVEIDEKNFPKLE